MILWKMVWLEELNTFLFEIKKLNPFVNLTHIIEPFFFRFEYDSHYWTFFLNMTQRNSFLFLNMFEIYWFSSKNMTQRIELFFFENMTQRIEPFLLNLTQRFFLPFFMTQILEPFSHDSKNFNFFFFEL